PDILVILDADHADRPDLLDRLVNPIVEDRADLVLSDRSRTAEPGALTSTQRHGNWLATRLIRLVSGHRYRDMGPFRAIRWTSLQDLEMEDPTWGWNVEMQIKAVRHELRILEIPMPYRPRAAGRSKISGTLGGTVRAGSRILWAVGRYARG
ncbi:MAG: glycosyltransferase, partial [Deltaproteobacteria bacterium]|nr:glycosyltransferase [Deltaproteobacteria bacterium]